ILLGLVIILVVAKLGEVWARRLGLPQVLGELSMGMLLGNLYLFSGWQFFDPIKEMSFLRALGDLGAMTLLLSVGLHTDLRSILQVGPSAFLVAMVGIIAPVGLGLLVCQVLIPDASTYAKLFLVATLCVNSVGIAIRVFKEMGRLDTPEARIVIAATILDAILIFIAVGVLSDIVQRGQFGVADILRTGGFTILFFFLVGVVTLRYGKEIGDYVTREFPESLKVFTLTVVCLSLAYLAWAIGMTAIVGALVAGLLMRDIRARDSNGNERSMEELIRPAYWTLVPIFFVLLGTEVRLEGFLDRRVILLGLVLTVVAVLGKLVSGMGVRERGVNRLWVGVGMVPRAEMALIVAGLGMSAKVFDYLSYSTIMVMIVITSLAGPPILKRLLYVPEDLEVFRRQEGKYEI
ncbi:MAG: cation:proton antiporter, partial [Candidatus Brocadiales bacterium]